MSCDIHRILNGDFDVLRIHTCPKQDEIAIKYKYNNFILNHKKTFNVTRYVGKLRSVFIYLISYY